MTGVAWPVSWSTIHLPMPDGHRLPVRDMAACLLHSITHEAPVLSIIGTTSQPGQILTTSTTEGTGSHRLAYQAIQ